MLAKVDEVTDGLIRPSRSKNRNSTRGRDIQIRRRDRHM
jgi:hypothetical protein